MRVLIASKRAPNRVVRRNGGVQTWVATIAHELRALGHEVCIADAQIMPQGRFDAGILANAAYTASYAKQCTRSIVVSHGVIDAERPHGGDIHAFTSEEVRDRWGGNGPVIRQPIRLDFWKPGGEIRRNIVRYAARKGLRYARPMAWDMGCQFIHLSNVTHKMALRTLQTARCVIASGRCAVEAMACGAPVVICDDRGYQGPLLDMDTTGAMRRNYSGRGGVMPNRPMLTEAVHKAIRRGSLVKHVQEHHDSRKVAEQLLGLLWST
jgi:hypothetical protein